MKRDDIYRKLRQDIISGILKEGEKLPTEFECAAQFSVSRDTVRESLKLLEKDGLIERIKAKGTFVRIPKIESEERNISFLVPCYEYLRCTGIRGLNLMFELIAQAAICGWRITPVIYSKTNDPNDIWWENLSHFNADSRIIVNRDWFMPYFETLKSIGARVAYIDNDCQPQEKTKGWLNFIEQDRIAAKKTFAYLKAQGCRKIAVFMPNIDHQNNTIALEYRKFVRESGQECLLYPTPRMEEPDRSVLDVSGKIRNLAESGLIDGLLIHTNELLLPMKGSFRASLGLPEGFPVVAIPSKIDQIFSLPEERLPIVHYPIKEMARDIVQALTAGQHVPRTFYYEPELQICGKQIIIS